jgi:integrase
LVLDGLVLSKSDKTWQTYAVWWSVFEVYCEMEGVEAWEADLETLAAVMQGLLADLFYHGGYAVSSLKLLLTAVSSRLKDVRKESLRRYEELGRQLEGYERKEGRAKRKKPPMTEAHAKGFMEAEQPQWGGRFGGLKWVQWTAIALLAWLVFLRSQEISNLELCDLTWGAEEMVVRLRKTKNDVKSECREATVCYDREGDCMLTVIEDYVVERHGSTEPREGCTRGSEPAAPCAV